MIKTKIIKRTEISIDGGTQQRESINQSIVAEYAEAMRCGVKFPSITVFFDGAQYWLADGFHRLHAHEAAGIDQISCDVHDGTNRQAQLFSFGVNGTHGLRLTNADKRKSVIGMLSDKEWSTWPNREIARHCNVSHQLVNKIKDELEISSSKVSQVATVATQTPKTPKEIEPEEQESSLEYSQEDEALAEAHETVIALAEENQQLKDAIAVGNLPLPEQTAGDIIRELRARVKTLEAILASTESQRDAYMREVKGLKDQCDMQRREIKKMGGK